MRRSSIITAAILAVAAGTLLPLGAEAGSRLHFNYFTYEPGYRTYYPGPVYAPRPRYFYYYDYDDEPPYAYDYEPEYYEPEYAPRYKPQRYKRPARLYEAQKPRRKTKTVTYDEPTEPDVKAKAIEPETIENEPKPVESKPVKKKAAGMSCDKAAKIVADYGFGSVKAASCTGAVYSFKGSRDGKAYSIKLSAKSGELTEVKKL